MGVNNDEIRFWNNWYAIKGHCTVFILQDVKNITYLVVFVYNLKKGRG